MNNTETETVSVTQKPRITITRWATERGLLNAVRLLPDADRKRLGDALRYCERHADSVLNAQRAIAETLKRIEAVIAAGTNANLGMDQSS